MGTDQTMAAACPACGGEMKFDPVSSKLKCEFCASLFTPEEVDAYWKEKEKAAGAPQQEAPQEGEDWDIAKDGMKTYGCSTCGAELIANETTAVMRCPYCGNQTIVPGQFSGSIKPDHIIPFAHTKDEAVSRYHQYYQKRFLLPKSFVTDNHVSEIQGVYVPFWLFSGRASIDATYDAADVERREDYEIRTHYDVKRKGTLSYENVPTDASKRMEDSLMDSVEPYKMDEMKPFSLTYLPGFLAERFDVAKEENEKRAHDRVKGTICDETQKTVHHNEIVSKQEQVDFHEEKTGYALLPVWLLTTRWNEKEYKFAMNGQTGKMIGDLPISVPKFLGVIAAVFFAILLIGLLFLDAGAVLIIDLIVVAIVGFVMYGSMKPVVQAADADHYVSETLTLTEQTETFTRKEKRKKS
ncbi:MAG: hypothetical protein IJJ13_06720 [Lachnospiraceae bacterium]|nr:hypothetical protein [Lachnospiraceae bacterium]